MATKTGVGFSSAPDAALAGRAAAQDAIKNLGGDRTDLVLVFASAGYAYAPLLGAVREVTGKAPLIGCSNAGAFTHQSAGNEAVVIMGIESDAMRFSIGIGKGVKADQERAVREAMANFDPEHRAARAEGLTHATCILMSDGLAGNGEDLVERVQNLAPLAQIVGGAAADQAKFERTDVFFNGEHHSDAMVVARVFSRSPIGLGVRHGLNAGCESMIVSKAAGNVISEIDGKPATQIYEAFAKTIGQTLGPGDIEAFMMTHEIGMLTPTGEYKIRAPIKANADGSIVMASEIPMGSAVSIMRGTKEGLVTGAELAARSALANLGGGRPAGVLVFDCICRRIFLGDQYTRQVDAFRGVVGKDVPIAGWQTYGEIAMTPSQQSGWHNSTTVLAILPA